MSLGIYVCLGNGCVSCVVWETKLGVVVGCGCVLAALSFIPSSTLYLPSAKSPIVGLLQIHLLPIQSSPNGIRSTCTLPIRSNPIHSATDSRLALAASRRSAAQQSSAPNQTSDPGPCCFACRANTALSPLRRRSRRRWRRRRISCVFLF